jgi:hypothetical protein
VRRQQQRRDLFSRRPLAATAGEEFEVEVFGGEEFEVEVFGGEEFEVEVFGGMAEGEARCRWLTTT